jgi:hypothetical protein
LEFIKRYAEDSGKRVEALKEKDNNWWVEEIGTIYAISRNSYGTMRQLHWCDN